MKRTKDNFELYKKSKDELYTFLNNQSQSHPKDWDLLDHLILVIDIVVTQYVSLGFTDKEIRDEVGMICTTVRRRDQKKLN